MDLLGDLTFITVHDHIILILKTDICIAYMSIHPSWDDGIFIFYWQSICIFSFIEIMIVTAWKVSKYGVFYCPYFNVFGLNRKVRTRKNSVFGHFSSSEWYLSGFLQNLNPTTSSLSGRAFTCSKLEIETLEQDVK